jgi:aminoglycoside phosphotransferase (APT) family kinase protein
LTLYDWERFGAGTPALDLAITVPWLGDKKIFETVAARYLSGCDAAPDLSASNVAHLAEEIGAAKIWSVIEFLSMYQEGTVINADAIEELVRDFPEWLKSVTTERRL